MCSWTDATWRHVDIYHTREMEIHSTWRKRDNWDDSSKIIWDDTEREDSKYSQDHEERGSKYQRKKDWNWKYFELSRGRFGSLSKERQIVYTISKWHNVCERDSLRSRSQECSRLCFERQFRSRRVQCIMCESSFCTTSCLVVSEGDCIVIVWVSSCHRTSTGKSRHMKRRRAADVWMFAKSSLGISNMERVWIIVQQFFGKNMRRWSRQYRE